jgi:hypothetical protein
LRSSLGTRWERSSPDTQDFQAPAFYRKHGYSVFGELPDLPPGHVRYSLAKPFDVGMGEGRASDD